MPVPPRRSIRRLASCLVASAMISGIMTAPAFAAECGESPAHEAFDVQGLKSELMVTALSCDARDQYNAFVGKFRSHLTAEEKHLDGYFKTTYGRNAQREHDDYITQLANVQSEGGLRAGTVFCKQRIAMFEEVAELEDGADLAHYAEAKDIVQPASYEVCGAASAVATESHSSHRSRHGRSRA